MRVEIYFPLRRRPRTPEQLDQSIANASGPRMQMLNRQPRRPPRKRRSHPPPLRAQSETRTRSPCLLFLPLTRVYLSEPTGKTLWRETTPSLDRIRPFGLFAPGSAFTLRRRMWGNQKSDRWRGPRRNPDLKQNPQYPRPLPTSLHRLRRTSLRSTCRVFHSKRRDPCSERRACECIKNR